MSTIAIQELSIPSSQGRLYTKSWEPPGHAGRAPIVLFHDSLGCVELWRDFPDRLSQAAGRKVIAYDRLGFGRSDPCTGKLGRSFVTDEAHEGFQQLREHLDIDAFIAFGHSVGGGMAVGCAAAYGDSCRALVTESAQALVDRGIRDGILQAQHDFAQPGQLERLAKYHGDKAAWVLSAWIDTWLAPWFADWTLDEALRQVSCPVLALHGDKDEFGSLAHPERIASLTEGKMVIVENCGHVPHREHADQVLSTVADWLARNA